MPQWSRDRSETSGDDADERRFGSCAAADAAPREVQSLFDRVAWEDE